MECDEMRERIARALYLARFSEMPWFRHHPTWEHAPEDQSRACLREADAVLAALSDVPAPTDLAVPTAQVAAKLHTPDDPFVEENQIVSAPTERVARWPGDLTGRPAPQAEPTDEAWKKERQLYEGNWTVAEPDRCPTCGSDDRERREGECRIGGSPDHWHEGADR